MVYVNINIIDQDLEIDAIFIWRELCIDSL